MVPEDARPVVFEREYTSVSRLHARQRGDDTRKKCKNKTTSSEVFYTLSLDTKGHSTLQAALDAHVQSEYISDFKCTKCMNKRDDKTSVNNGSLKKYTNMKLNVCHKNMVYIYFITLN